MNNKNNESPSQAAQRLAKRFISQGFKLEEIYRYENLNRQPIYWRIRFTNSQGDKKIFPMHIDSGVYHLKEPTFDAYKPLYRQVEITTDSQNRLVYVVEGERCVDRLVNRGLLATTSGGASSARRADWSILKGRNVTIWPDNDEPGKQYVCEVAQQLDAIGCAVSVIDITALDLPESGDCVDWLARNPQATNDDIASLPTKSIAEVISDTYVNTQLQEFNPEENKIFKKTQASILVDFAIKRVELFYDEDSYTYALDISTHEVRRLGSRKFKDWLVAIFYESTGKSPSEQIIREVISILSGLARRNGKCHKVYIRMAEYQEKYFLDLAEAGNSRAICIEAGSWKIIDNPPVRFLRPETIRALPEPISGGDMIKFWEIVNISENDRALVITWLIECLRPDTPFPVLELIGEHGSAKSTTQTMLRQLIDPNACDLRAAPKTVEDVFVCAGVNWLVSYENISHLSSQMQDALCILSTGGGYAKRKLFSDTDESVIKTKRPIILNSISAAITAQDLIDRTISIETPLITHRTESTELKLIYEKGYAGFLGALLNIFAQSLIYLPTIELEPAARPRLIEFMRLGIAVSKTIGKRKEDFLAQFNLSRAESIARTIDASPVATALIEWFEDRDKQTIVLTVKDLFSQVERKRPTNTEGWPRSAKGFADALRRVAPALRQMGIACRSLGKRGGFVSWEIKRCN